MGAKRGSAAGLRPSGPSPEAPVEAAGMRRTWIVAGVAVAVAAVLAASGFAIWGFLGRTSQPAVDRSELEALDARLAEIDATLTPIARSFTSIPETAPIDLQDYRARIASARKLVGSVNDLPTTSSEALEIRDQILTGASQVLDGMSTALDALAADDASATAGAAAQVDEGMSALDDARSRLEQLLGTRSTT